jgi:hypothetical protein
MYSHIANKNYIDYKQYRKFFKEKHLLKLSNYD